MNVDLGIWDRLTRLVLFLVVIAALIGIFFWYLPLFRQNERMRKEILLLETKVKKEEDIARQLDATICSRGFVLLSGLNESQITLLESLQARLHACVLDMFASAASHPSRG